MQNTIPQGQAAAAEVVCALSCPLCIAGPGESCGIISAGEHFARWAQARKLGLITAEQIGAAIDSITVICDGALIEAGK